MDKPNRLQLLFFSLSIIGGAVTNYLSVRYIMFGVGFLVFLYAISESLLKRIWFSLVGILARSHKFRAGSAPTTQESLGQSRFQLFTAWMDRRISQENDSSLFSPPSGDWKVNGIKAVMDFREGIIRGIRTALGEEAGKEYAKHVGTTSMLFWPSEEQARRFVGDCVDKLRELRRVVTANQLLPNFDPRDLNG